MGYFGLALITVDMRLALLLILGGFLAPYFYIPKSYA